MLGNFLQNGERHRRPDLEMFSKHLQFSLENLSHKKGMPPDPEGVSLLMSHMRPTMEFLEDAARFVPASVFTASKDPREQEREANVFAQRLAEHVYKVEADMPQLEARVSVLPNAERFWRPGWQSRVRTAAYFEFVSHYGVQRKGEKDEHGHALPYSEHPRRTAFDAIIHKVGLIDEEMFCAELLHDVHEDLDKGMLVAKARGSSKDISRISRGFIASKEIQPSDSQHGTIDINKLVSLVDKARAREILGRNANRTEAQICLFYLLSEMSDEEFLTYGIRVILMKMGDRIDNDGSIANLDPEKFSAIWLETCYVYLSMTDSLDMRNCQEWFYDLLERVKSNERLQHGIRRREDELIHDLPQKFVIRIQEELAEAGFQPNDVQIIFRPRGIRHMSPSEIMGQQGNPYSQGLEFLNFLNFVPTADTPMRNKELAEVLKGILRRIFPYKALQKYGEQFTQFGKHYTYRTDIAPASMTQSGIHRRSQDELQDNDWFGYSAYRVFSDREDFCREYYGAPHAAILLDDEDAKAALLMLRNSLKSYAPTLIKTLKQIDSVSDQDSTAVGRVKGFMRDSASRLLAPIFSMKRILRPEERDLLRKVVYAFFYTIVGSKKHQTRLIDQSVKSRDGSEIFQDAFGPSATPIITAFVTTDITALVSKPLKAHVELDAESVTRVVKHEHQRRGKKSLSCDNFDEFERARDLNASPFGASIRCQNIRYEVDRAQQDMRLGHYCLTTLNRTLHERVERVRSAGNIRDVPENVLRITAVYR